MKVQQALQELTRAVQVLARKIEAERIEPRLISPEKAAVRAGICRNKVWEMIGTGKIGTVKIGRRVLINLKEWDDLTDSFDRKIPKVN